VAGGQWAVEPPATTFCPVPKILTLFSLFFHRNLLCSTVSAQLGGDLLLPSFRLSRTVLNIQVRAVLTLSRCDSVCQ